MKSPFTVKNTISLLVTAGVSKVIDDAIDATAPEEVKIPAKILRKIGAWSLGYFIGDWAGEKAEQAYDTISESVKEIKDKVSEVQAQMNASSEEDSENETVEAEPVDAAEPETVFN